MVAVMQSVIKSRENEDDKNNSTDWMKFNIDIILILFLIHKELQQHKWFFVALQI